MPERINLKLTRSLRQHLISWQITQINPGPVVTTFEFKPDAGIKYSRITNLTDDLCLALKAESILIERMPGKSTVGIQVPNREREIIWLRENIESQEFMGSKSKLTMAMGKDINGRIVTADLNGFAADKLVMNQKLEANALKVVANNQGYQVKGDVKINGQAATLDYKKPAEGDADIKLQATLDDASRARLGLDLGSAASGAIPIKLTGKIGGPDRDSKMGIEADLTALKLDNILPGWVKAAGKSGKSAPVETPAEGTSYPILDWLIVVAMIGLAVFVVCRTSRRT